MSACLYKQTNVSDVFAMRSAFRCAATHSIMALFRVWTVNLYQAAFRLLSRFDFGEASQSAAR